ETEKILMGPDTLSAAQGIGAEIPQDLHGAARPCNLANPRTWSGKPGWSYFCIRVADTKILLAHASWVFLRSAAKKCAQIPKGEKQRGEHRQKPGILIKCPSPQAGSVVFFCSRV
ncbi:MAG: hypothetical protein LBT33_10680, partial [Spirochaetia bacterium]|nr:hypothetical protein [Spirochaetia bacterium]